MTWAAVDARAEPPQLAIGASRAEADLCLQVPGMTQSKTDQIWRTALTWPAYVAFKAVWSVQPITESAALMEWAAAKHTEITGRYAMRDALDAPEPLATQLELMTTGGTLSPVQRGSVAWLLRYRRAITADPTGNGKSPPLIRALQLLAQDHEGLPALIISPGASLLSWERKLNAWAPELRVAVVAGTSTARARGLASQADVYVIAWENAQIHTRLASYPGQAMGRCPDHGGTNPKITAGRCEVHVKELNGLGLRTVIADECHRMGNPRSKMTRAVQWLAHHAENFWPVSGTLSRDDVSDLWPVLHALDPLAWPVRSRYIDLYARKDWAWGRGAPDILGLRADTAAYFYLAVEPYFRLIPRGIARAGQPVRLPAEFRYPEMAPAQRKAYRELARELELELDGQTMVPGSAAVKFARLVQLASSMVELSDGEDRAGFTRQVVDLRLPSSKADDLVQFLLDNPGQWVVADYSPPMLALCARKMDEASKKTGAVPADWTWTSITGGMTHDMKDAAAVAFQNGQYRVIFITEAGKESIDLYAARGIYFVRPNPSFEATEQLIGRVDRWGQQNDVRVIYAVSAGTADERLLALGRDKAERHQEITRSADMMRWVVQAPGGNDDNRASYSAS